MPTEKKCSECGTVFHCFNIPGETDCWCAKLPNVIPLTEGAQCLCEECLGEKIQKFKIQDSKITHESLNLEF